jgi:hypothetical protein
MDELPKKNKKTPFFATLSAEEKKAFYERNKELRLQKKENKSVVLEEARHKAEKMLPELIALDMLRTQMPDYVPRQETIAAVRHIMSNGGYTMERLRTEHFPNLSDEQWSNFTKYLFKSHVAHAEQLGLDILTVKKKTISILQARLEKLEVELKKAKKDNPKIVGTVLKLITETESRMLEIETDVAKTLYSVGVVGEKQASQVLHVHTSIPRPSPKDVTIGANGEVQNTNEPNQN